MKNWKKGEVNANRFFDTKSGWLVSFTLTWTAAIGGGVLLGKKWPWFAYVFDKYPIISSIIWFLLNVFLIMTLLQVYFTLLEIQKDKNDKR